MTDNLTDTELNEWLAELMGWTIGKERIIRPDGSSFDAPLANMPDDPLYGNYSIPDYCNDLDQAFMCVEKSNVMVDIRFDPWREKYKWTICGHDGSRVADTDTPARSICEAVYQAKEGK